MKFSELGLHPSVLAGVEANQFVECTPIQEVAIPVILAGRDLAGFAQTGTGKTAAFVLPLIDKIIRSREAAKGVAVPEGAHPVFKDWRRTNFILVLVPTRELAEQVYENVTRLGKTSDITGTSIYGGTGYDAQKAAIKQGIDFIVATPGRLIDLYKDHQIDLNQVRAIVFDEADRMFDMGFKDDMKFILQRVPQDRQFLVFSATLNFDVLNTAYEFGANPVEVNVSRDQAKADNVEDEIFHVGHYDKPKFLISLLQKHKPKQTIIFSNFKHSVERIAQFLTSNGVPAMGISSLISQSQRTRIMELFRNQNNDRNILVATDVAARGLDIKGVDLVINFELPDDAENYVHRIGRTGRAGEKGKAFSLVGDRDVEALQRIETYLGHKVTIGWIDDTELVKDFKEFPREEGRREYRGHDSRGGDSRGGGGGFRGGDKRGPRRDGERPRFNNDRPRGDRPQGDRPPRNDRPHGDKPHDNNRPVQEGRPQGDRPHQGGRPAHHRGGPNRNEHPRHGQGGSGPRNDQPRHGGDRGPRRDGDRPKFNPNHRRPQHERNANGGGPNRPQRTGFKHKPGTSAPAAKPGVVSAVSGFFKKLFGS